MPSNVNFIDPRHNVHDDFFTLYSEVETELKYYDKYFEDKIVYCNCDEGDKSNFWNYFYNNFERLKLKKLICTYYNFGGPSYKWEYTGEEIIKTKLLDCYKNESWGSYDSSECLEILDSADIVVTNPPFSLIKDFIPTIMEHGKKLLMLCTVQWLTYTKVHQYLLNDELWPGHKYNVAMEFRVPDNYGRETNDKCFIAADGTKHCKVPSICWITNIGERNIVKQEFNKKYSAEEYPRYDNYNAIEVKYVKSLPIDYTGAMGVPITFMKYYDPKQYKILDIISPVLFDETKFKRLIIKKRKEN